MGPLPKISSLSIVSLKSIYTVSLNYICHFELCLSRFKNPSVHQNTIK